MNFHVGMKVVCIDPGIFTDFLTKDEVYTVIAVGSQLGNDGDWISVDCKPSSLRGPGDRSFRAQRFRPVVECKTDTGMAILRKLLTDTRIKEPTC